MIKNERQYRITQARLEEFRQGIAQSEKERRTSKLHSKLQQAQVDALRSQLQTLKRELREYEDLRSGRHKVLTYTSFDELPKALVQARIARGWTQKDLAGRVGLDEQKIQDYEATDYQRASLARIREIVRALEIEIREEVKRRRRPASVRRAGLRAAPLEMVIRDGCRKRRRVRWPRGWHRAHHLTPAEHLGIEIGDRQHEGQFDRRTDLQQVLGAKQHARTADVLGQPLTPDAFSDRTVAQRQVKREALSARGFLLQAGSSLGSRSEGHLRRVQA